MINVDSYAIPIEATNDGDPLGFFESRADAVDYLERLGLELYEDESTGLLRGYDIESGENYGGEDGCKIPPQVIHAYMLAHPVEKEPAWQIVPPPKGKRGRSS